MLDHKQFLPHEQKRSLIVDRNTESSLSTAGALLQSLQGIKLQSLQSFSYNGHQMTDLSPESCYNNNNRLFYILFKWCRRGMAGESPPCLIIWPTRCIRLCVVDFHSLRFSYILLRTSSFIILLVHLTFIIRL